MPRAPRVITPQLPEQPFELPGDELTDEEIEQASVGDLISIQGPEFESVKWSIWRHRTRAEMAAEHSSGEPLEWVADRMGQLHGGELVEAIGGGTFQMRGYVPRSDGRGVRLKFNRTIALAGPRKNFAVVATSEPTNVATNGEKRPSKTERLLIHLVKQMDERLSRFEQHQAPPAPAPTSIKELAETMVLLNGMNGPRVVPKDPDAEIVKTYIGMIQQGIELGQSREAVPISEGGSSIDWAKIAETGMSLLDKLMARAQAQQRARRAPSSAEVVEPPATTSTPPAPAAEVAPVMSHRWLTAIESMADSIAEGDDPVDFASDLGRILNKQEIGLLRLASVDDILERCAPFLEALPVLGTEPAKVFIAGVLAEVQNPTADEGQAG